MSERTRGLNYSKIIIKWIVKNIWICEKMSYYQPKTYITGNITTTNDGALVEETITIPFPTPSFNQYGSNMNIQFNALKLKSLQIEIAEVANYLDVAADHFIITITPNSAATHPNITDNDCLFKWAIYQGLASAATNTSIGQLFTVKRWPLKDIYINKPQFYMQISLDSAGGLVYYKLEYEIVKLNMGQAAYEANRRGYTSS